VRYNPEQSNAKLIPTGTWCDALIINSIDTKSKQGNEMIEADFKIYDPAGLQPTIKHYFVDKNPGMFKKLCTVLDLNFESGNIPAESLVGKMVKVLIKIREDKSGEFPDKNVLAAFAKSDSPQAPRQTESTGTTEDSGDPLPF
jgi:hypothetical protein